MECSHWLHQEALKFSISIMYSTYTVTEVDLEHYLRGCIFIYSGSGRPISFEINLISNEINLSEPE